MVKRCTVAPLRAYYDRHYVCQDVMVPMSALESTLGLLDEELHVNMRYPATRDLKYSLVTPGLPSSALPIQPPVTARARSEPEWGEPPLRRHQDLRQEFAGG